LHSCAWPLALAWLPPRRRCPAWTFVFVGFKKVSMTWCIRLSRKRDGSVPECLRTNLADVSSDTVSDDRLCRKYFEFVPIGLRDATPQAAVDLVPSLALMKAGRSADFKYDYQAMIMNNEMSRFARERDAVAEEWIAWARTQSSNRVIG